MSFLFIFQNQIFSMAFLFWLILSLFLMFATCWDNLSDFWDYLCTFVNPIWLTLEELVKYRNSAALSGNYSSWKEKNYFTSNTNVRVKKRNSSVLVMKIATAGWLTATTTGKLDLCKLTVTWIKHWKSFVNISNADFHVHFIEN